MCTWYVCAPCPPPPPQGCGCDQHRRDLSHHRWHLLRGGPWVRETESVQLEERIGRSGCNADITGQLHLLSPPLTSKVGVREVVRCKGSMVPVRGGMGGV